MKEILHTIYAGLWMMVATALTCISCTDYELEKSTRVEEGVPITVNLKLSNASVTDVKVETRAGGDDLSKLVNLTIYVYDRNGNFQQKVSTLDGTLELDPSTGTTYSVQFQTTSGVKNLLAVGNRNGGFWKADGIDVTQMSFDELRKNLLNLNYTEYEGDISTPIQIISDEQMLISGWNKGISFDTNGSVVDWGESSENIAVKMKRVMAYVTFNIPSASTTNSNGNTVTFVPASYKVYNVPLKAMLANMDNVPIDEEIEFKNFAPTNITTPNEGKYSFGFFMPENVYTPDPDKIGMTYNDRDAWSGESGTTASEKQWTNAPQTSTFVIIMGSYEEKDANGNTVYTGNVQYTVHLGDFNPETGTINNFSVERNCSYTYNVTVKGVNEIVVEAKKEGEGQNGAEGQIYSYQGTSFTYHLDAHYEQVYLEYNLSSIAEAAHNAVKAAQDADEILSVEDAIANNLILVIQSEAMDYNKDTEYYSTHNKRGTLKPYKVYIDGLHNPKVTKESVLNGEGTEMKPTKGFDYKWVEMWPQGEKETLVSYPGVSEWSRENLKGMNNDASVVYGSTTPTENSKRLIDVYDAIVAMGKAVRKIYANEYEDGVNTITTGQINEDKIWLSKDGDNYMARFTAFINEYYYYRHPLTGASVAYWSVLVNKIPREMVIAMSSNTSNDGNSTLSTVYSYISQLSMQTPYSDRNDIALAAFGMETYNETPLNWSQGFTSRTTVPNGVSASAGRNNQKLWLGLYNYGTTYWNTYVNAAKNGYIQSNSMIHSEHKLTDAYNRKYYDNACMSRNRDLNGDGKITDNEVRWYLASVNEYLRMGLGAQAVASTARLFIGEKSKMTHSGYPASYIADGAMFFTSSSNSERVYWAVEKGAWGSDTSHDLDSKTTLPIRCVRVLPAVGSGSNADMTDLDVEAEPFFKKHTVWSNGYSNTVLEFKDRMVPSMFRTRTDSPLEEHNEEGAANRFSEGIIVARDNTSTFTSIQNLNGITHKNSRYNITNPTKTDPCESYREYGDGGAKWRTPNLNELVMMQRAMGDLDADVSCCTQFSNSDVRLGFATDNGNKIITCAVATYTSNYNSGYWSSYKSYKVRCVRDVPEGYNFPND